MVLLRLVSFGSRHVIYMAWLQNNRTDVRTFLLKKLHNRNVGPFDVMHL